MLILDGITLPVDSREDDALERAAGRLKLSAGDIKDIWVSKVSVDARKGRVRLVYGVSLRLADPGREERLASAAPNVRFGREERITFKTGNRQLAHPPVVVGFGPAGFFRTLALARMGYEPVVIEQGGSVEERLAAVSRFENERVLDTRSNVQFGEGGAGTFSDGKLTTRISDPRCAWVTRRLVEHGAPAEIAKKAKPHIGTDLLAGVVRNIREDIIRLGGRVMFNTRMTDILTEKGAVKGIRTTAGDIPAEAVILATGHSAREVFPMVEKRGLVLSAKPFSVGVRIEHLSEDIDRALYHSLAGHPALPRGEYQLSVTDGERGVYTFCMCPGGVVVAASSEEGTVVTNGMSRHARDGRNSNSALVVSVPDDDFGGDYKKAVRFQRELETRAFLMGGSDYSAPARTVGRFIEGKGGCEWGRVIPTYPLGVREADLDLLFPRFITSSLRRALPLMDRKLRGFAAPDAVLTGPETRTSSPVRIHRNERLEGDIRGIYPTGEGAGYAGGIMSAAADGVRVAQRICAEYSPAPH